MAISDYISDSVRRAAGRIYGDIEGSIAESIHYHAGVIQKKFIRGLTSSILMVSAFVLLIIAFIFFLAEYANLGLPLSMLAGSVIMFAIGGVLKVL